MNVAEHRSPIVRAAAGLPVTAGGPAEVLGSIVTELVLAAQELSTQTDIDVDLGWSAWLDELDKLAYKVPGLKHPNRERPLQIADNFGDGFEITRGCLGRIEAVAAVAWAALEAQTGRQYQPAVEGRRWIEGEGGG